MLIDGINTGTIGTFDGRDLSVDGTKLDGVEASAAADQTGAEIKTSYEGETNAFTDSQFTKLGGIATGATVDQTGAAIKSAYEGETNAFTDAQFTKLGGIATGATVDQDKTAIDALGINATQLGGSTASAFMAVAGDDMTGTLGIGTTYTENYAAVGASAIAVNTASLFSKTISGATTFTFTGAPTSGKVGSFTLELTNGGSSAVTWPGTVDFAGGTAPTLTSSGVDTLTFHTRNAGTTWFGYAAGLDMK